MGMYLQMLVCAMAREVIIDCDTCGIVSGISARNLAVDGRCGLVVSGETS